MLVFCKRVGSNYGVIDTDDGALDWVSKEELLNFAKQVKILGVESGLSLHPKSVVLESRLCNWCKNGNIFKYAKSFRINPSHKFELRTVDGKVFKGALDLYFGNTALYFNNNVIVRIDANIGKGLCSSDNNIVKQAVNSLA